MAEQKYVVATEHLYADPHHYVLAHAPGDLVPVENVERMGWSDGVAGANTKAAAKATDAAK